MKRLLAMLLTGCMLAQSLSGSAVVALGAEPDGVITLDGGGAVADVSEEDMFAVDTGSDVDLGIMEEISPEDTLTIPDVSEEGGDLSLDADGNAVVDEGNTDGLTGDEIIDEIEIIPSAGEDGIAKEPEEDVELPEDVQELFDGEALEIDAVSAGDVTAVSAEDEAMGRVEVTVASGLPFYPKEGLPVKVAVFNEDGTSAKMDSGLDAVGTVTLKSETEKGVVGFDLAPGTYFVEVNAPKFASYRQRIEVGLRQLLKINVSTSGSKPVTDENGNVCRVGWIRLGDVESAGVIGHNDIDLILAAIHGEDIAPHNADLNEDGKVDTADLQIAARSLYLYDEKNEPLSTVEKQQLPLNVTTKAAVKNGGDINALLTSAKEGEGSSAVVTLGPENGGAITNANPVEVTFELGREGTAVLPKVGGMTIQAPTNQTDSDGKKRSGISSGVVEVTGIIEEGGESKEVTLQVPMGSSSSAPVYYAEPEAVEDTVVTITAEEPAGEAPASEEAADEVIVGDTAEILEADETPDMAAQDAASADGTQDVEISDHAEDDMELAESAGAAAADLPVVQASSKASVAKDGSLVLDFGQQVAVKKVTIKITGSTTGNNLVDIAKVEFVNDMASRIPEPELNIPKELEADPGNEEFTVNWTAAENVTGYEIEVSGEVKKAAGTQTQIIRVSGTEYLVTSINTYSLKNFKEYTVRVRSVNGEWNSPWSDPIKVTPVPEGKPDPVDNLKVTGGYRSLLLSWKEMKDADGYMVYYKEKTEGVSAEDKNGYIPVVEGFVLPSSDPPENATLEEREKNGEGRITANSYTITGLPDDASYYVYVIGWNEKGWGQNPPPVEKIQEARTTTAHVPQLPRYHAVNLPETDAEGNEIVGRVTQHVTGAWKGTYYNPPMEQSPLDDADENVRSAWGIVDNNYESYWFRANDWDDGVDVPAGNMDKGVVVQLDQEYDMSYLSFSATDLGKNLPQKAAVYYWNGTSAERQYMPASLITKTDEYDNTIFVVKFNRDIRANKVQLCLGTGYSRIDMKIAEIRFHSCDDLYNNIMDLYADEMHAVLKEGVTEEQIAGLRTALDEKDPETGELHPLYDTLKNELDYAEKLLKQTGLEPIEIDTRITTSQDGHLGFGGLNAWQPIGKVAAKGETLVVYVGHNTKCIGENSGLKMVFTQYHAQSDGLSSEITLKVGRNDITVTKIRDEVRERGGQIYIAYTGNDSSDKYTVRVAGGTDIPVLNIYKKTGEAKKTAIRDYVAALEKYVSTIPAKHEELHKSSADKWKDNVNFSYDEKNCFLNATDLMMEHMMYSVPALQVWNGIKDASDKAQKLEDSLDAMEKTMKLFYQHKGLSNAAAAGENGKNAIPIQHLNIRYMTMFSGAFMYASGNHIGVEYPETVMAGGAADWNSFGWGVAHEIGHDINQGSYAIAEITNNYFAQLLTKKTNGTRFDYKDIYEKVTSGAKGRSSNVGIQLGLYWQLHLAFDNYADSETASYRYNGETYSCAGDRYIFADDDYENMFNNLFFARVDTYARNPGKAPQPGLEIAGNVDQTLMRLSCAAANANILPFFERWGMEPDAETLAYAEKYGKPVEKALYYVNDGARDYRRTHSESSSTVGGKDVVKATATDAGNVVTINISTTAGDDLLGYEIIRGMYSGGKLQDEVVGFQLAGEGSKTAVYTDTVATINNRVMYYKVRAVDKFLNYSNPADAGSVKITTDGVLSRNEWTVETTMTSNQDSVLVNSGGTGTYDKNSSEDPDSGCYYNVADNKPVTVEPARKHSVTQVLDGNKGTEYVSTSGGEIVIDMHKFNDVSSLKYIGTDPVKVSVSKDNSEWTYVKGSENGGIESGVIVRGSDYSTIWFDSADPDPAVRAAWIGTYQARYVKLEYNSTVSISEIEVCGPSGDNVEFMTVSSGELSADQTVIGTLANDYRYADGKDADGNEHVIPKGSLIFTGTYKGNPAFNVLILYDKNGNIVGMDGDGGVKSEQIIFANVPEKGNLGNTSDGRWLYYVRPENAASALKAITDNGGRIRAELYRVDNAQTLAGQRLVSDSKFIGVSANLPEISVTGGRIPGLAK